MKDAENGAKQTLAKPVNNEDANENQWEEKATPRQGWKEKATSESEEKAARVRKRQQGWGEGEGEENVNVREKWYPRVNISH